MEGGSPQVVKWVHPDRVYCDYRSEGGASAVVVNRVDLGCRREWNVYIASWTMAEGSKNRIQHPLAGKAVVCQSAKSCFEFLEWLRLQNDGFVIPEMALTSLAQEAAAPDIPSIEQQKIVRH
jgi:hypothetical protein